ncbi:MAG: patatin-like phospholipase family protein [Gaiella sp.]|nr:patatin-like phospholipase family protein [Gaiella sp.]
MRPEVITAAGGEAAVSVPTLAAVPLFAGADRDALQALAADARPVRALAGEWVMRAGDEADDLFVVLRGRLRVVVGAHGEERTVRVLGPGAAIGELALLTESPRSASVQAVRDTTLLRLGRHAFVELIERDSGFAAAVARELASQLQASGGLEAPPSRPALVALRRLDPGVPLAAVASSLAQALATYGPVTILDASAAGTDAVECAEDENAHVLVLDESGAGVWSDLCARQADRMLLVGTAESVPPPSSSPEADLVILGPSSGEALRSLLDAVAPRAHHRLATTEPSDPGVGRLARRLVGRALGVVLSGGGARGFAHIGALAELDAAGIEIDRYGGCSMGSLIAAMAAAGWSPNDIRDRCHEELVRRSPFNDYTIPRVALIRSRKAARMFDRLFGELTIEELAKPLFTVSADLLSSRLVVHRRGSVIEAVGASMSIPGLVPPLSRGGRLLVDGGVLNNLPIDAMADAGEGPIVAVDVVRRLEASADATPALPSIMETLSRATVLGSVERAERNRDLALLVITPDVQDIPLREFGALDLAIEAGREATRRALESGGADTILAAVRAPVGSGTAAARRARPWGLAPQVPDPGDAADLVTPSFSGEPPGPE